MRVQVGRVKISLCPHGKRRFSAVLETDITAAVRGQHTRSLSLFDQEMSSARQSAAATYEATVVRHHTRHSFSCPGANVEMGLFTYKVHENLGHP